ncbi:RNA-processing protein HAT helix [Penicillium angulare]|uniref:RNA-processing protein HAT helix n=1 Tax=Penicillium angulare TaxID=116970 RepID=UPI0025421688|nr:RNA-processing protein HAT helix [Penicillium angulare]KAJ5287991.1 RNA-processing protein HAT helix [Penicillium angulare]
MADDEAEQAFFQAQALEAQSDNVVAIEDQTADNEDEDEDEYDPSTTLDDQYDLNPGNEDLSDAEEDATAAAPDPTATPEVDASATGDAPDPSQEPPNAESQSSTPIPTAGTSAQPQARTIGGFVDEDDDEDDDEDEENEEDEEADYEPPAALEVDDTNSMPMTMSGDPSSGNANQNTSPDVSLHLAVQDAASVPAVANSLYSPVPVSNIDPAASAQGPWTGAALDASHQTSTAPTPIPDESAASKGRLPHDTVGILQDRVDEDPRGDLKAWLELIAEHQKRNRLDSAREVFERFLKLFPMAADQWVDYAKMESDLNELFRLEQIFSRTLLTIPSVKLWSVYLDYVRRRNPLTTDTTGQARRVISSAYDLALQYVGMDKEAGDIWTNYVEFIRSSPGTVGGTGWQDQQKMDLLRKAYQKAICVPTQAVNALWKEYDQFEMGLNKMTGRKFLQEYSPSFVTARSSYTELQNLTRELKRTSFCRLPPILGSDGDEEYAKQVDIWKRWIAWEKEDPLVLKEDDPAAFKARVVYVYKQALMTLRFLPEIWFDASEFCFLNDMENEGNELLKQGIEANPESCLLSFKRADRLEATSDSEQDSTKRAAKVREPYDSLLEALYQLITKAKAQESQEIARIEESFAALNPEGQGAFNEDDDDVPNEVKERAAAKSAQIEAAQKSHGSQINLLSKTVSFAWIALMRSMRRIQGKGKPGELAGSRQIFAEARKRGRITSDVYIASALMEHHCYKDPAATKIFERGAKLFPEDGEFALEYLKHLIDINDIINARAVFETTVRRLTSNPENAHKAKPIFAFFHEYESRYGDLGQINHLETRMRELFPEESALYQFSHRYAVPSFDPTAVQLILSSTQIKPKSAQPDMLPESRLDLQDTSLSSPKRPYPVDDDYDSDRPRKFVRAESPLKAVQGRRPDQQKRVQQLNGQMTSSYKPQGSPAPLPRDVVHLLSIMPSASAYNIARLSPEKMVDLLRRTDIPGSTSQIPLPAHARGLGGAQNSYTGKSALPLPS